MFLLEEKKSKANYIILGNQIHFTPLISKYIFI